MATVLLVKEINSMIEDCNQIVVKKECIKDLISHLDSIKGILQELERASPEDSALGTLKESLRNAQLLLNKYKVKRRLYWVVCLHSLNQEVEQLVHSIAKSLGEIQLASSPLSEDVSSKLTQLIQDMNRAHYEAVDVESELVELEDTSSQLKKFATSLGINFERDKDILARELRYFKVDIADSPNSSLKKIVDEVLESLNLENSTTLQTQESEEAIPSFESFECPLTRQMMKDPVVLESEITYERGAIEEWFRTCWQQNKQPTCPVTGKVLATTEVHSNLVLRQTIDEWYQRNVSARIKAVSGKLKNLEDVDDALEEILKLSNENHLNKFKLKEASLIPDIAKIWSLESAAYFRAKALAVLNKMAADDMDNQKVIVEEGLLRCAVRSLGSKEEEEKANAARLLYHVSHQTEVCAKLGTLKGAIIHLVSLTASKDQDLALISEKTLKNLEQVDANVLEMTDAGRLQPLLARLCEGSEESKIEMARFLSKRHLVKSQKKLVAQTATKSLLEMFSGNNIEAKEASLGVFLILSEDNRDTLIESELLTPLLTIMFNIQSLLNTQALKLKENAATVVANLVAAPGHWEGRSVDSQGNTMHSEEVVHSLLGLMQHVKPDWKPSLLQILIGLASSPQVADETCTHIGSGHGIRICLAFLSDLSERLRIKAVKLLSVISSKIGAEIATELKAGDGMVTLQKMLRSKNNEERTAAASTLGSIPLSKQQVKSLLVPEFVGWTLDTLSEVRSSRHGRSFTRMMSEMSEGLLGILLHILKSDDPVILSELRQHEVVKVVLNHMDRQGEFLIKKRAALTIKMMSEKAPKLSRQPEPPKKSLFCFSAKRVRVCPVHKGVCETGSSSFCMLENKSLLMVLDLLEEEDDGVQLGAMEAISTLFTNSDGIRGAVEEMVKVDGLQKVINVFYGLQRGELQDKTVWVIERILRVEEYSKTYAVDTRLFKTLIEVFKHGSPASKALAQDALTNLKQLSGVSAKKKTR